MLTSLKKTNWLIVASLVTVVYLVGLLYQLGWAKVIKFLSPESDLNAIGDFLAGVFAPVALIWLVAAVFTQRQELNETREQFEENRKIVDAQLKTINSQNSLLALQHNQAAESARRTYRLNLFGERYKIYEEFIAFGAKHHKSHFMGDAYLQMTELTHRASLVFGREIEEWFEQICQAIHDNEEARRRFVTFEDDGYGNQTVTFTNEPAAREIEVTEAWLWEQFHLSHERTERFYKYLHISDE